MAGQTAGKQTGKRPGQDRGQHSGSRDGAKSGKRAGAADLGKGGGVDAGGRDGKAPRQAGRRAVEMAKGKAAKSEESKRKAAQGTAAKSKAPKGKVRGSRKPAGESAGSRETMRIAKRMARAGLCSRRDGERWIADGRVMVNGKVLDTPAFEVGPRDRILVDGQPLPEIEAVRLWRYHKPKGLVTTHRDPQGRPTVFDALPSSLPRVVSIGRLDFNTEGLLLLTNDGELARHLELPSTGWLRRYRVRVHGKINQQDLDRLKDGVTVEGVTYGPIEATLDSTQGSNSWLTLALREGKNREVRKVLGSLGVSVNRLIRVSYGPFQLLDLKPGDVDAVRRRVLADQLGPRLAEQFGLFDQT